MSTSAQTTTAARGTQNPLKTLTNYGQSVWLDYIRRSLISSGELKRLIDEDGLRGVTSNPAIFEKAITGSTDYTQTLQELQKRKDLDAMGMFEILAIHDIQDAADVLRPVYEQTSAATATSAWKFPLSWPRIRREPSRKRAGCGKRWPRQRDGQGPRDARRDSGHQDS